MQEVKPHSLVLLAASSSLAHTACHWTVQLCVATKGKQSSLLHACFVHFGIQFAAWYMHCTSIIYTSGSIIIPVFIVRGYPAQDMRAFAHGVCSFLLL